jgi:hypothetical protein
MVDKYFSLTTLHGMICVLQNNTTVFGHHLYFTLRSSQTSSIILTLKVVKMVISGSCYIPYFVEVLKTVLIFGLPE